MNLLQQVETEKYSRIERRTRKPILASTWLYPVGRSRLTRRDAIAVTDAIVKSRVDSAGQLAALASSWWSVAVRLTAQQVRVADEARVVGDTARPRHERSCVHTALCTHTSARAHAQSAHFASRLLQPYSYCVIVRFVQ